ncbi:PREDICTED: B-box zinc finger protein 32-like [Nelumbo nucifera]|uniref:B box-type domain-containing protein n=2 Tax=Nelumbo nucifera TaxID=4432 RepID=A0A822ZIG4_NELNU|nr:PREDICTED: B-box zinc finger protein 32-like [Nelumbo nucifera]DAD45904.1 TPA_asm: hypothetical protein HUJ06_004134 [Nelumbo nucifera]
MKESVCELCSGEASLYCSSDSAFLCWNCDARVHEANFLVARHVRRTVCIKCKGFDGKRVSGVGFRPVQSVCRSCSPETGDEDPEYSSSSSSSACISSSESRAVAPPKKIDFDRRRQDKIGCLSSVTEVSGDDLSSKKTMKKRTKVPRSRAPASLDVNAEGILVNWCRKLGLKNICSVRLASHAFGICLRKLTILPFRASLAASLWFSLKLCEGRSASTCQNLKRLEEISGVPAKLILLGEAKLSRVLKIKRSQQHDLEEGWAECSD